MERLTAFAAVALVMVAGCGRACAPSPESRASDTHEPQERIMVPSADEVPDEWDFYLGRVDDSPASIFVNFWFQDAAPLSDVSVLHWSAIQILQPGEHGMGIDPDANALTTIEHQIAAEATKLGLYYVGRLRNQGRWQMVFYGAANTEERLRDITAHAAGEREYEVGTKEDAAWSYYLDFLLPDAERRRWMLDDRVVQRLEAHGDSLGTSRRVDHWAYFATSERRDAFLRDVKAQGFRVEQSNDTDARGNESALRFGAQVHRVDSVSLEEIHAIVMKLSELAAAQGGKYDGWETQVVVGARGGTPEL